MFSTSTSPSKWVTEPAFEIGTAAASPMAKTCGEAVDCSVCSSTGTKPSASPRPGERVDVRARRCAPGSPPPGRRAPRGRRRTPAGRLDPRTTSPVLNSVTSSIPRSSSMPAEAPAGHRLGEGPVERGHVGDARPGRACPCCWKNQSARKQNSSGATGHLIGISTTLTTRRPPSNHSSASARAVRALGVVEREGLLVPPGTGQALRLLRRQHGTSGDDQDVVGE